MNFDKKQKAKSRQGERLSNIIAQVREEGHRVTPQRMAILHAVLENSSHSTAEEIHQQVSAELPMISLATVYKTLNMLKEMRVVTELKLDGRRHYDSNSSPHPHLICSKCQAIIDLPPESMPQLPQDVLNETGFRAQRYEVNIHGLCPRCQSEAESL